MSAATPALDGKSFDACMEPKQEIAGLKLKMDQNKMSKASDVSGKNTHASLSKDFVGSPFEHNNVLPLDTRTTPNINCQHSTIGIIIALLLLHFRVIGEFTRRMFYYSGISMFFHVY